MDTHCPVCQKPYGKRQRCYFCTGRKRSGEVRQCRQCGKDFYVQVNTAQDAARNSGTYCSRRCKHQAQHYISRAPDSKQIHSAGYVLVFAPGHPRATRGRVLEHILVMEKQIGRYIGTDEQIHHRDRNKANNDPSNLLLLSPEEHTRLHAAENAATVMAKRVRLNCAECGKEFTTTAYRAKSTDSRSHARYCSRPCQAKGRNKAGLKARKEKLGY